LIGEEEATFSPLIGTDGVCTHATLSAARLYITALKSFAVVFQTIIVRAWMLSMEQCWTVKMAGTMDKCDEVFATKMRWCSEAVFTHTHTHTTHIVMIYGRCVYPCASRLQCLVQIQFTSTLNLCGSFQRCLDRGSRDITTPCVRSRKLIRTIALLSAAFTERPRDSPGRTEHFTKLIPGCTTVDNDNLRNPASHLRQ